MSHKFFTLLLLLFMHPKNTRPFFSPITDDSSHLFKLEVSYVSASLFVAAIMSAVSHLEFLDFVSHFKMHFCTS